MAAGNRRNRPDHDGAHRLAFDRNKRKILATQNICGICGLPVNKELYKYPHPLSACVDHIIPIDRGGHPSDLSNLQLAHWKCNRAKSNKIIFPIKTKGKDGEETTVTASNANRIFPLSMNWAAYKARS